MSVGGADHRIPQCNHFTLFGSAVSVVEFPPHRKFLCWMLQKFPVRRSCSTVCWLSFCRVSPALKALREDRYHWVRATPHFLEENVAVRFLLGERYFRELSVFRRLLILKLLICRPKDCLEKGNLTIRELNVFRTSLISKLLILLILRPKDCTCDRTVSVPRPFW